MKVIVLGGTGFIGRRFVELYGEQFEAVLVVTRSGRSSGVATDRYRYCTIDELLSGAVKADGIDALVHAAFDHDYLRNKSLMRAAVDLVRKCSIPRLIYLSSIAVYDPFTEGNISEKNGYATENDPYTAEKRRMEMLLMNMARRIEGISVSVLQPTIVFGLGGNWTRNGSEGALSAVLDLPAKGEGICNVIHVNDVAAAIMSRVRAPADQRTARYIVTGPGRLTWKQFYEGHAQALGVTLRDDQFLDCGARFHPGKPINALLTIWFCTPLGNVFNWLLRIMKMVRGKKEHGSSRPAAAEIKQRLQQGVQGTYRPIAMSRVAHACRYLPETADVHHLYGDNRTSFAEGIAEMKRRLQ